MKKLFFVIMLATMMLGVASADDFLWDVPLGIPIEDAVSQLCDITGMELSFEYALDKIYGKRTVPHYSSNEVWISGIPFKVDVYADNFSHFNKLDISLTETSVRGIESVSDVLSAANKLSTVLQASLGLPSFSGLVFFANENMDDRIYFDIPMNESGFDISTIRSIPKLISRPIIVFCWDYVTFSTTYYPDEDTGELHLFSMSICEESAPYFSTTNLEYCGVYDEAILKSKTGITSF